MIAVAAFALASSFVWADENGRMELRDNGQPVFAYNYEMQLRNGAPEVKRRQGYVHPLWAPNGAVVTDDFPKDHWHHRGVFWAWPVVEYGDKKYDMWTLTGGIESRRQKELHMGVHSLDALNGWCVGDELIASETVRIDAGPLIGKERKISFDIAIKAVKPFRMAGMQDGKGYGGFNVRFAPREGTVVRTEAGVEAKDTDLVPHPWAELEATYAGKKARVRVESDQSNPGYPQGWCLRNYGFIGANYPGKEFITMAPGQELRVRYVVTVASVE